LKYHVAKGSCMARKAIPLSSMAAKGAWLADGRVPVAAGDLECGGWVGGGWSGMHWVWVWQG
jgi:hypothetical protein